MQVTSLQGGISMNWILIDIGSVQTKVTLVRKEKDSWYLIDSIKTTTSIETTDKSAEVGVKEAVEKILSDNNIEIEKIEKFQIGSTAGGGLQMVVAGVVRTMTAESARRAALGSGAVVIDIINAGSPVKQPERLNQFKNTKPDIILLAGGTEGGNVKQVLGLAETINAANIRTRWGNEYASVVFAGNSEIQDEVIEFLGSKIEVKIAENIRPELEREQIETVNEAIQKLYIDKVAKNVSGFQKLNDYYKTDIKPLASDMKRFIEIYSKNQNNNTMMIDVGGFTTDIYSSIEYVRREYKQATKNRTQIIRTSVGVVKERKSFASIAADAGLNYSAPRLLRGAGPEKIENWLDDANRKEIFNACFNRMINPLDVSIYQDKLTKALIANALEIGLIEHQAIASKLHGVGIVRNISETFSQEGTSDGTLAGWEAIDEVILTGGAFGVLLDREVVQIFNDALQPYGITSVLRDANDRLSQLVLNNTMDSSYLNMVYNQITNLASIIRPMDIQAQAGTNLAEIVINQDGNKNTYELNDNQIKFVNLEGTNIDITVNPDRRVDFGAGFGTSITKKVNESLYGLVLDGRRSIKTKVNQANIEKWYGTGLSFLKRGESNE